MLSDKLLGWTLSMGICSGWQLGVDFLSIQEWKIEEWMCDNDKHKKWDTLLCSNCWHLDSAINNV